MDYDGDYDDYTAKSGKSKSGKSSDNYSSLLNLAEGSTVAQVSNKAGDRIGKHDVAWILLVALLLPLLI